MKCEICGKDILKDSQCIDYKYYHNDCIINLTKENKELKEHIEKYEHYCKTTGIEELMKENKKYKEVIEKAIDYVENGDLLYLASKCSIIYRNNVEVVAICDRLNELLDILKEVE